MRKFMHRTVENLSEINPENATERTVFYEKSKSSQTLNSEPILTEEETEVLNETKKQLTKNIPKSLEEYTDPIKADKKMESIKKEIELEISSHTRTKQKLEFKNRSLRKAKSSLAKVQQELETALKNDSDEFQNKKLQMMGEMSSKMAHDIRNPLTVLSAQIQLMKLKQKRREDDELATSLSRMESAITSIGNQIDDVMKFIRTPELEKRSCDLKEIIEESIEDIEIPKNIDLEVYLVSCEIQCDTTKIKGIITNIIKNSLDELESKGRISIMLEDLEEHAKISISDSGMGIPNSNLKKIFDPMFTTKPLGTGLGLASCKELIERHDGKITVVNSPTTFTITLPK